MPLALVAMLGNPPLWGKILSHTSLDLSGRAVAAVLDRDEGGGGKTQRSLTWP